MTHIDWLLENWKENKLTPRERLRLLQMLDQQDGLEQFQQLWEENWATHRTQADPTDSIGERLEEIRGEIKTQIRKDQPLQRTKRLRWAATLVAGVALLLAGWWMLRPEEKGQSLEPTYAGARPLEARVEKGGRLQKVALADGSVVWLNVDTRLTYPATFSDTLRQVWITGEAYFEVSEDSTRPFIVSFADLQTRVLGTTFYVSAYPDAPVAVTLETGRVQVTRSPGEQVVLHPRDQLQVDPNRDHWQVRPVDLAELGTWREGKLAYAGIPLAELAPRLGRWYGVQIEIESDRARSCWIYGQPTDQSIWDLLDSFRAIRGITYEVDEAGVIHIRGGDCPPIPD